MRPVSDPGDSASPLPWSAPMVGSSIMSTVFLESSCLTSQAHEATSHTNIRGGLMTCQREHHQTFHLSSALHTHRTHIAHTSLTPRTQHTQNTHTRAHNTARRTQYAHTRRHRRPVRNHNPTIRTQRSAMHACSHHARTQRGRTSTNPYDLLFEQSLREGR